MRIIKITASWCPSCLITNDMIKDIINEYDIDLIEYDFDLDQETVSKYNPGTILPVLIKETESGEEVSRLVGEKSKKEIIEFIEG